MALRLAVVDDWEADRTLLMDGLRCYLQRRQVAAEILCYQSGEAFLADFAPGKFTVVFLDIYMEGLDGMAVARRIRKVDQNCLLVFITSSSDHAIEGFEVRAFHYLLKPYSPQRLQAVLDCCFERLGAEDAYLEVKSGRLSLRLLLREILYIDISGHYVQFHFGDHVERSRMRFQEVASLLQQDGRFLLCYRNVIVNMDLVRSIQGRDFQMINGDLVPIQDFRFREVTQAFADYLFQKAKGGAWNERV